MNTKSNSLSEDIISACESVKLRDSITAAIAGGFICAIVGFGLGAELYRPAVLTKQDVNGDGKMDYVVNGAFNFISTGEEDYKPIPVEPSEAFKHAVSAEKYEGVYQTTFNPEYKPR